MEVTLQQMFHQDIYLLISLRQDLNSVQWKANPQSGTIVSNFNYIPESRHVCKIEYVFHQLIIWLSNWKFANRNAASSCLNEKHTG